MIAKLVMGAACVLGLTTVGLSVMDTAKTAGPQPYAKPSAVGDDVYASGYVTREEMENLQSQLTADNWDEAQRLAAANKRPILVITDDGSPVVKKLERNAARGMMDSLMQKVIHFRIKPEEKLALGVNGSVALFEFNGAKSIDLASNGSLAELSVRIARTYSPRA